MDDGGGKEFREAWIEGVRRHYPGQPKPGYIAPWKEMPPWEQESAAAVHRQVVAFLVATGGRAASLSRAQKGQFVAVCWAGQVYRHFPDSKPSYVAGWVDLPGWQQETDADIFEQIERRLAAA